MTVRLSVRDILYNSVTVTVRLSLTKENITLRKLLHVWVVLYKDRDERQRVQDNRWAILQNKRWETGTNRFMSYVVAQQTNMMRMKKKAVLTHINIKEGPFDKTRESQQIPD